VNRFNLGLKGVRESVAICRIPVNSGALAYLAAHIARLVSDSRLRTHKESTSFTRLNLSNQEDVILSRASGKSIE